MFLSYEEMFSTHSTEFIEERKRMNGPGNSAKSLQKLVENVSFLCV